MPADMHTVKQTPTRLFATRARAGSEAGPDHSSTIPSAAPIVPTPSDAIESRGLLERRSTSTATMMQIVPAVIATRSGRPSSQNAENSIEAYHGENGHQQSLAHHCIRYHLGSSGFVAKTATAQTTSLRTRSFLAFERDRPIATSIKAGTRRAAAGTGLIQEELRRAFRSRRQFHAATRRRRQSRIYLRCIAK